MIKPKQCKECGKSFKPKYSTLEDACSPECKVKIEARKKSTTRVIRVVGPKVYKPTLKTCKICKSKFTPRNVIAESFCQEYKCKVAYAMQVVEKQKIANEKKRRKNNLAEKKVLRDKLKTLSEYETEAKKSFQKYIRMRDAGKPCISCGNKNPVDWCGSHYFSAGIYSGLIFDERNCNGACNTYCNLYLSGNLIEYRKGLIKRYGIEFVEKLESDADTMRNYKYTKQELIEKKLYYDAKIKELK